MPLNLLYGKKSWREVADFCSFVGISSQLADYVNFSLPTEWIQNRYKIILLLLFAYNIFL